MILLQTAQDSLKIADGSGVFTYTRQTRLDVVNMVMQTGAATVLTAAQARARTGVHRQCESCVHEVIEHGPGGCTKCSCKCEVDV